MDDQRRRYVAYGLIALCLFAVGIAAAAHINGTVGIKNGVVLNSSDGTQVNVTGDTEILLDPSKDDPFPTSSQIHVMTEAGNATFDASGEAKATVDKSEIEGTWTNVTAIDADPNTITIDPGDKDSFVVGKSMKNVSIKDSFAVDDGNVDLVYGASANGRLTLQGLPTNTNIAAVDDDTGTTLDADSTGGSGQITFSSLDSGQEHDVVLQSFTPVSPTLSNGKPTGDLTSDPTQLSIDLKDGDFPITDSVDVEFDVDGSDAGTTTLTSNGTATTSMPAAGKNGGSHTVDVTATDDYGNTATTSYTYNVPSKLSIRAEEPTHDLIKGTATNPVTVEGTFFEDTTSAPTIIDKSTTDGNISLDGLPVGSRFSVSVQAPGYNNRTVILEDIYTQSDVFLIDKGQTTIENRFSVSDRTGEFPTSETELVVQTAINESIYNGSGGFKWRNVAGDDLGADGALTTDLVEEKRYRLKVRNNNGDTRILGAYTAETAGTVELTIGSVTIEPKDGESVGTNATYVNNTAQQPKVIFEYNDTASNTSTLYMEIYEYNNESNVLLSNTSYSGPFGTFRSSETVPKGENDTTWVVDVTAKRSSTNVNVEQVVGPNVPLLSGMPGYMVALIFTGIIWTTAGLFSQLNGDIGAIVVAGLGAILWFFNLAPGYLGGAVVALALIAAALLFIRERDAGGL